MDEAYGWPLLSFRGGYDVVPLAQVNMQHDFGPALPEIWTHEPQNYQTCEPRTVPLRPMWRGVAVNSLVYGAAWWVVVVVTGATRRWLRQDSGVCRGCGYDLRGLASGAVCPECGAEAPA